MKANGQHTLERKGYRPPEFARALGLSTAMIYLMLRDGRIRGVRMGRAIVIPATELEALLAGEER